MTIDQITIFGIIILTFTLFIWGKWRYDIVSIIALCVLFISDQVLGGEKSGLIMDSSNIFMGFGHPAVITVAAVLIVSRALRNAGVVDVIARQITPLSKYQIVHISSLSGVVSIFSAIMNNVGALALMLPVALKTSAKQRRSPSVILMPLAFASILGGMITMIGTPPNIIIATLRESQYMELKTQALADKSSPAAEYFISQNINIEQFHPEPFGMLDFSPVGGIIAILGVLFVALVGWRFIPKESYKKPGTESLFSIDKYITEIRIPKDCKFISKQISEIEKYTEDRLTIIGCISNNGNIFTPRHDEIIKEGDRFQIQADPVDLKLMMDEYGLRLTTKMRARIDQLKDKYTTYKEVLITPESKLVQRDRTYFRKRTSNSLILMAVARQGQPISKRLGNLIFRVGDVLLIQGNIDNLDDNISSLNLVPLAQREVQVGIFSRVNLSLLIFCGAIGFSIAGLLPTTLAFVCAILLYVFTGILPIRELYQQVDWPIIILLGAMIPVSAALQTTGSTQLIAEFMVNMTGSLPNWSILAIIMIITMCLSDIINNAATALIMAPISVGIAVSMGVNADPFLMTVAVGASCAFLTPIGHQCNALILGPGGYRFSDYWRMGLPLEFLIVIVGTPLILYFWPF
ncbi:MAG TPA: SLC13 family permease [Candidatus Marinimicrobia bacterium]|nr:SLC13 family permease [Candidatus Neomarinimicrobiota bacterium]|tara:strand:+ start:799 stop:2697 length:1899 start_codon:yes stop_codon:yes gene_type:complete